MDMQKATLVLEGGATRGVFTSGVLDYLMEQEFAKKWKKYIMEQRK